MSQPLEPKFQRRETGVLAGNCQRLAISFPVMEQEPLVGFDRCSAHACGSCNPTFSAPRQKHLQVNAANPEGVLAEALHCQKLQIFIEKRGERLRARSVPSASCLPVTQYLACLAKHVFFMMPPEISILPRPVSCFL